MLSQTLIYALRASVYLASVYGNSCTVREIADATHVPADYLAKILRSMIRHGIVSSRPGRNGGYELCFDPEEVSLFEIVEAVEPIRVNDKCPLGNNCAQVTLCPLHSALRKATTDFLGALKAANLSSLVRQAATKEPGDQPEEARSLVGGAL